MYTAVTSSVTFNGPSQLGTTLDCTAAGRGGQEYVQEGLGVVVVVRYASVHQSLAELFVKRPFSEC